jgi:hypothetical protein
MANKELFNLPPAIPSDSKRIAFGDTANTANNITFGDFKTWLGITTGTTKTLVTPIGVWNMATTSSTGMINLSFPMQPGQIFPVSVDITKIRGIKVLIQNDTGTALSDFLSVQNGTASTVPQIQIGVFSFIFPATYVLLTRRASSFYTTQPGYTGSGNRGWIITEYID